MSIPTEDEFSEMNDIEQRIADILTDYLSEYEDPQEGHSWMKYQAAAKLLVSELGLARYQTADQCPLCRGANNG
jgi:hypothetical protein